MTYVELGRLTRNILQWNKNDIKSTRMTTGDYWRVRYSDPHYNFIFMNQVTKQLAQFTTIDVALSVGGLDLRLQEAALRKNPDIVIATPGR